MVKLQTLIKLKLQDLVSINIWEIPNIMTPILLKMPAEIIKKI